MSIAIEIDNYRRPKYVKVEEISYKYRFFKRLTDISFSLFALIVLFPFMLLIALLIVLDDPKKGPIFVQNRVGLNGKIFKFYKFRSMYGDAEDQLDELKQKNEVDGPAFKIKNDPRITRIGYFLRNTSIDELPQLVNILKGDMSLVGPRPPITREVIDYDNYQKQRLLTKPGLTCFWQVEKNRHDLSFDEWVALDLKYIEERNYLLDWKLILKTFLVVFSCKAD